MSTFPRPPAAIPADLPRDIRLQIVSTCPEIPDGDAWLHEIKHDGHRLLAIVGPDSLQLRLPFRVFALSRCRNPEVLRQSTQQHRRLGGSHFVSL